MSIVLTPTVRRGFWLKFGDVFRAMHLRFLIRSTEFDVVGLKHDLRQLPKRIDAAEKHAAELRVELGVLEQT